jgi:hypothetical protein
MYCKDWQLNNLEGFIGNLLYKGIRRDKKLLIFHTTAGFLEIVSPPSPGEG